MTTLEPKPFRKTPEQFKKQNKYLESLTADELVAHRKRVRFMKTKYAKGSEAAKQRGRDAAAKRISTGTGAAGVRANPFTAEQKEMLRKMWFDDGLQPGVRAASLYLKATYPGKKVPTQRNIQAWFKDIDTYQINMRPARSKDIQSGLLKVKAPYQALAVDLIQRGQSKTSKGGLLYILNMIDSFSRKYYTAVLPNKEARTVRNALKKIFDENRRPGGKPLGRIIKFDGGVEFNNDLVSKLLKEEGIAVVSSPSGRAVPNIERANQTLRTLVQKMADEKGISWRTALPHITKALNEMIPNRITGMIPDAVMKLPKEEVRALAARVVGKLGARRDVVQGKDDIAVAKAGEPPTAVRIKATSKYGKGGIVKFMTDNWSKEVYAITRVKKSKDSSRATTYQVEGRPGINFTRNDVQLLPPGTKTSSQKQIEDAIEQERLDAEEAVEEEKRAEVKVRAREVKRAERAEVEADKPEWKYAVGDVVVATKAFFDEDTAGYKGKFPRVGTISKGPTEKVPYYYIKWADVKKKIKGKPVPGIGYGAEDMDEDDTISLRKKPKR